MAVKYKVIKKAEPGVIGGGNGKYYATPVVQGERSLEQITKSIEKICTVSGADIRAVLYSMVDVITDDLANGLIVRIGDLGSLRLSLSSEGFAKEKDVTASAIKSSKILFTPGPKLKEMQHTLKFEKVL
ncbi:HU family DNA-binding protein [Parasediminibacterium paludis]|uniref:HU family DNA-binding protein n=1 Tax=Parasediminibacterium paludis TaxID=908966 RepID=A0ABV8Q0Y6_9BACT